MMVKVLLFAAFVSLAFALWDGEGGLEVFLELGVIVVILIVNVVVGVVMEKNVECVIEELKKYEADVVTCTRDGEKRKVNVEVFVFGDIVEIVMGEKVFVDCWLVKIYFNVLWCD